MMMEREHFVQCQCVSWFRREYPELALNLFAVPNGGARSAATGGKLKAEGVTAGVADLLLLVPNKEHHGLCIEMKVDAIKAPGIERGKTYQRQSQKMWQRAVEVQGYEYKVCRNLIEFQSIIKLYIDG